MAQMSVVRRYLLPIAAAVVPVVMLVLVAAWLQPDVRVSGLSDGGAITPRALGEVEIATTADVEQVTVLLDGAAVPISRDGERIRLAPEEPTADGPHTLLVRAPGSSIVAPGNDTRLEFTVDSAPPELTVAPVTPTELGSTAQVHGTATGATTVLAGDRPVEPAEDGSFSVSVPADKGRVDIVARDAAGNTASEQVRIPIRHPGMRAVHMTAHAWSSAALREPILEMAREGLIDTVQLDIKDESGQIGYLSQVPLAQKIGAAKDYYDARAALDQMHAAGLRVVGRLVAFRDPVLAEASWESGHRDRVIQTAGGAPWSGGYGEYAFTNFANPEVRAYNIAIAEEAARLGFDDILYDYVRRPDGVLSNMRFPGLTTTPEKSIAQFFAETLPEVRQHGALLGASVFGIAATRPQEIAQNIPMISEYADYVSPMVYPSHWGPNEYNVAHPEAQPYDITARSLADFKNLAEESNTAVIPWLQAFSLSIPYGPEEVRAQIKAAADNGIDSFLLWNASCRYDAMALEPVSRE
jgi:hypothetical protein